jgi:hypothetical protein
MLTSFFQSQPAESSSHRAGRVRPLVLLAVVAGVGLAEPSPARADVATRDFGRLGADDPGAKSGNPGDPRTSTNGDDFDLFRLGAPIENFLPYSEEAATDTGSARSVRLTNASTSGATYYRWFIRQRRSNGAAFTNASPADPASYVFPSPLRTLANVAVANNRVNSGFAAVS